MRIAFNKDDMGHKIDSDSDLCLDDQDLERRRTSSQPNKSNDDDEEDLKLMGAEGYIPLRTL